MTVYYTDKKCIFEALNHICSVIYDELVMTEAFNFVKNVKIEMYDEDQEYTDEDICITAQNLQSEVTNMMQKYEINVATIFTSSIEGQLDKIFEEHCSDQSFKADISIKYTENSALETFFIINTSEDIRISRYDETSDEVLEYIGCNYAAINDIIYDYMDDFYYDMYTVEIDKYSASFLDSDEWDIMIFIKFTKKSKDGAI